MSQKQTKKKRKAAKNRIAHLMPPDIPIKDLPRNADGNLELPLKLPKNQKTFFKVPGDLAQLLIDYIQTKPYNEVHQLIGGLMRCEKVKE